MLELLTSQLPYVYWHSMCAQRYVCMCLYWGEGEFPNGFSDVNIHLNFFYAPLLHPPIKLALVKFNQTDCASDCCKHAALFFPKANWITIWRRVKRSLKKNIYINQDNFKGSVRLLYTGIYELVYLPVFPYRKSQ